ncbi:MAG TPA: class I SAM-dependent methyltransferase [Herpetosiphonaceae bacterium]
MGQQVDLYGSTYGSFAERVLATVRRETFGEDIGQNSWITADELRRFLAWLDLTATAQLLDVGCGSGGPALFIARASGCRVTGIDETPQAIATATQTAHAAGLSQSLRFQVADANASLLWTSATFDAILCIDAINHLADRRRVLQEWHRVLKPGGRVLFTDPVVVTGAITKDEIAVRSSIGHFVFVPRGENERQLEAVGFRVLRCEDVTENAAQVACRWQHARERHGAELVQLEGEERFVGLQAFFAMVHRLSSERRLSRLAYLAQKAGIDEASTL